MLEQLKLALSLVSAVVGDLPGRSSSISRVIASLREILTAGAAGVDAASAIAPIVRQIITTLKSRGDITAEQRVQLEELEAESDAEFDKEAARAETLSKPKVDAKPKQAEQTQPLKA